MEIRVQTLNTVHAAFIYHRNGVFADFRNIGAVPESILEVSKRTTDVFNGIVHPKNVIIY